MQPLTIASAFALVTVTLLSSPQPASGVCCGGLQHAVSHWFSNINLWGANVMLRAQQCGDCSKPTPYCGVGQCNLFGCNCVGGCREGDCGRQKRSVDGLESAEDGAGANNIIEAGDKNGDGDLSMREAQVLLRRNGVYAKLHTLSQMDADHDGKLSPEEIDVDAVPTDYIMTRTNN